MSFHQRLTELIAQRGRLCVGLDPQPSVLEAWGLANDLAGIEKVCFTMLEALGEQVAVFKPQSAFFEAHGSQGVALLAKVLAAIKEAGALSLLDVKRGDIGSSVAGYAQAYLSDGSDLAADAITMSPYLGFESLLPAFQLAHQNQRGVYVLARTSNPESAPVQLALTNQGGAAQVNVAQAIVLQAQSLNEELDNLIGIVVGGTHEDLGIDLTGFNGSILVPGIGAQGGRIDQLAKLFGPALGNVLPTSSRQVMLAGPNLSELKAVASALSREMAGLSG